MALLASPAVLLSLAALFIASFIKVLRIGRRPAGYPPGPATIPILGNLHQMPTRDAHLQFQKWAKVVIQ